MAWAGAHCFPLKVFKTGEFVINTLRASRAHFMLCWNDAISD